MNNFGILFVGMGSPRSILLKYFNSMHFEEWSASSVGQIGVKGFRKVKTPYILVLF